MTEHGGDHAGIELVEDAASGETTLYIDGGQAMQAWEAELMEYSADLLCEFGTRFMEAGLGLGISALRIASRPTTTSHVVVEPHRRVIDLFRERHPSPPPSLAIREGDFFAVLPEVAPGSLDGIFFDPYLPPARYRDAALWNGMVAAVLRALRPGGAFMPCFTTRPYFPWLHHFERMIAVRRPFTAYATTEYTTTTSGEGFVQCYVKGG